jgi:AraC-like DNA-binding protein
VPVSLLDEFGRVPQPRDAGAPPERVTVARSREHPGLEVWLVTDSERLWTVFHTTLTLCATLTETARGQQLWRYRGDEYSMLSDSVMVLEPGEIHQTLRAPRASFIVVRIEEPLLATLADPDDAGGRGRVMPAQVDDPKMAQAVRRAAAGILRGTLDPMGIEALLTEALEIGSSTQGSGPGQRREPRRHPSEPAIRRAREFMHDNFASRTTLDDLAVASGISKSHLSRSFRNATGLSLHDYLVNVRVGHALQALQHGEAPKTVATRVGFFDQAHMTHALHARLGLTPAKYKTGSSLIRT